MNLTYKNTLPDKEQFFTLFQTTGWFPDQNLDADRLYAAINNTWHMVCAYDGDNLIGFGRIISDGTLHALIVEMIVLPEYQGKGIGSRILDDMVGECKAHDIIDIQLFCARDKALFYEKRVFIKRPEEMPGMQFVGKTDDT